jgi:hypothetical protein
MAWSSIPALESQRDWNGNNHGDTETMIIRSAIAGQFQRVAEEHGIAVAPLNDDLPLLDCGLDSLCLAVVVMRLEDMVGVDPFAREDIPFPVTFGEFVRLYEGVGR